MSRVETPFGFDTTAADVVAGLDLSGRLAIVTGGASGIGVETARALLQAGADVTLAVRDTAAGEAVAAELAQSAGDGAEERVHVGALDLTQLATVRAFARAWDGPLDILVNNAGVMALPDLRLNEDGHELQFATNHLGHFALALGLHDALAAAPAGRIVSVSSAGHLRSPVIFDDLDFAFRPYDPWLAYGQSKTANVLFAVAANERWAADGITANALMPGGIETPLQRHLDPSYMQQARAEGIPLKTTAQGAATSVLLAASPLLEGIGGRYFEDCAEAEPIERAGPRGSGGVAPYALDRDNAERLWELSERLVAG